MFCATHLARDVPDVDNGAQELIDFESTLPSPVAELFGAPISLVLLIPGGIFEVTLAIWLLVKGFNPASYAPGAQG